VDLPTYTSIWRIEKRLYKLYDFRLPMPLPVGQITVFAAIAIPYVVLLTLLGIPLSHTLIWLYLLPPGVATWLVTRPVLEGKRLPELVGSQLRYYLAEPRIWCRMAPSSESDVTVVSAKVWRLPPAVLAQLSSQVVRRRASRAEVLPNLRRRSARLLAGDPKSESAPPRLAERKAPAAAVPRQEARPSLAPRRETRRQEARRSEVAPVASAARRPERRSDGGQAAPVPAGIRLRGRGAADGSGHPAGQSAPTGQPAPPVPAGSRPGRLTADRPPAPAMSLLPGRPAPLDRPAGQGRPAPLGRQLRSPAAPPARTSVPPAPVPAAAASPEPAVPSVPEPAVRAAPERAEAGARPSVTVVGPAVSRAVPLPVERALADPSARRNDGRGGRVSVVPGGHRPGKLDQLARDRVRAQLPLNGHRSVIVLGCTVGAGQTITALLTSEVLASLRSDSVAVLDLNPAAESLAERALVRPALGQAASLAPSRLKVLSAPPVPGGGIDSAAAATAFDQARGEHQILIADPATVAVPRLLPAADQLILVAPASSAASHAISMTFEWLEAHGKADLAAGAIMVMNGVSRPSLAHVEQAERVCIGRCRAIVRVPWDDQLQNLSSARKPVAAQGQQTSARQWAGVLSPGTVSAYTALAGVLVAALAGSEPDQSPDQAGDPATSAIGQVGR
jgi:hypothetical protein